MLLSFRSSSILCSLVLWLVLVGSGSDRPSIYSVTEPPRLKIRRNVEFVWVDWASPHLKTHMRFPASYMNRPNKEVNSLLGEFLVNSGKVNFVLLTTCQRDNEPHSQTGVAKIHGQ